MGPMHYLMGTLFVVSLLLLVQLAYILDDLELRGLSGGRAAEPLILTPLIEAGALKEARAMAKVEHVGMENVTSYSGYLTVDKKYNSNVFFWFFPAKIDSKHAPVLLWLQGSPGVSSLFGLFVENGPFTLNEYKTYKYLGPYPRQYSWHVNHNLIYMDSPVGVGFSFTDDNRGFASNETAVARDVYLALIQFFTLFPMTKNEFYIAGESYAGKRIPAIAKLIKDNNPGARVKMNLQGMAIGGGLIDPYNQLDYGEYLYQLGLVDFNGRAAFQRLEEETKLLMDRGDWQGAYDAMSQLIGGDSGTPSLFKNLTGFDFAGNYLNASDSPASGWYVDFAGRPDVRRALHVGDVALGYESRLAVERLRLDAPRSVEARHLPELLGRYRLLLYGGQLDARRPATLAENFLRRMEWPGAEEYAAAGRRPWWVGGRLAGYAKTARNLTVVLVRNAGHWVAADQPEWAWELISRFTRRRAF